MRLSPQHEENLDHTVHLTHMFMLFPMQTCFLPVCPSLSTPFFFSMSSRDTIPHSCASQLWSQRVDDNYGLQKKKQNITMQTCVSILGRTLEAVITPKVQLFRLRQQEVKFFFSITTSLALHLLLESKRRAALCPTRSSPTKYSHMELIVTLTYASCT